MNNNTPIIDPYTRKERHQPSPGLSALRRLAARIATIFGGEASDADADSASNAGTRRTHHPEQRHSSVPRRLAARSGLATREIVTLIAVIVVITVLGAGALVVGRNWINNSHDRAAKETVDRVLAETESYWQQYAMNRDGRRLINYEEWCDYMNSQFTQEADLTLRALDTPTGAALTGAVPSATLTAGQKAVCDTTVILYASTTGDELGDWQNSGLGNSKSAMLIRPVQRTNQWDSTRVPGGTFVSPAAKAGERLEVVSVGTVSSTGKSFCAVFVLDADKRSSIGIYRFAAEPGSTGPIIPGECAAGSTAIEAGTDVNEPWPS